MHPHLTVLYNLQLTYNHVASAERRLSKLDWGESQQKQLAALRAEATTLAASKNATEAELKALEQDLAAIEAKLKRSTRRLSTGEIHNVHEMESTDREMDVLRLRRAEVEEQILVLMEEAEKFPPAASALVKKDQRLRREWEEIRRQSSEEKGKIEKEIAAVLVRREQLASELPPPLLKQFEHIRQHQAGVAVVRVVSGTCDACHVSVPESILHAIVATSEFVPCQGCGRILYTDHD